MTRWACQACPLEGRYRRIANMCTVRRGADAVGRRDNAGGYARNLFALCIFDDSWSLAPVVYTNMFTALSKSHDCVNAGAALCKERRIDTPHKGIPTYRHIPIYNEIYP